jgi:hypothetical protein
MRWFSDELDTKNEVRLDSGQFVRRLPDRAVGLAEADAFAVSLSVSICVHLRLVFS